MSPPTSATHRSDLYGAVFWMVLGAAIVTGAWTMDRLERFQVKPYEAPGLVPGLLGALVVALGIALLVRSLSGRRSPEVPGTAEDAGSEDADGTPAAAPGGIMLGLSLSLLYALLLVGRGLPFWLATFIYVTAFVSLLDGERQQLLGRSRTAVLVRAAVYGAIVSLVVTVVFQSIFLVRLP